MKFPLRKLRSLAQYSVLAAGVMMVIFVVANFKEKELIAKKVIDPEESAWEGLKDETREIPRLPHNNVGIEDIQKDSLPDSNTMVDWHNYTFIQLEKERVGPGEQGKPLVIPREEESQHDDLFRSNGFSGYVSDLVSIDRAVPDIRHPGCKSKLYHAQLPSVSVVIPFYNEHWSTLLRTFHSVINRSPASLLMEVILVDDASTKPDLQMQLEEYIEHLPKVTLVRMKERGGLITARLEGAKKASADVIIFLDSHTEANVNWLPPLLDPISQDYRTAVCPFIDVVAYDTLEYRAQDEGARGAFDWQLFYKRLPLLPEDLKHPTEPFKSPVMAGGLFAISAKFFWELGGYDPGLEIWGGEQYELSFKIWQCGGTMVDAPCSRVGHIYRKYSPFGGAGRGDYLGRNYKRVAAVWMDEYAEYVYKQRPHYRNMDPGDISEQVALRKKLQCKPFKWFMKEIAFDLPKHYPPVEPPDFISGFIQSVEDPDLCVDSGGSLSGSGKEVGLKKCNKNNDQKFLLSWRKDIRLRNRRKMCWDVNSYDPEAPVTLWECHAQGGNQYWSYDDDRKWLIHGGNPRCLDHDPESERLFVSKCDKNKRTQRWNVEDVNLEQLAKWDDPMKDLF